MKTVKKRYVTGEDKIQTRVEKRSGVEKLKKSWKKKSVVGGGNVGVETGASEALNNGKKLKNQGDSMKVQREKGGEPTNLGGACGGEKKV